MGSLGHRFCRFEDPTFQYFRVLNLVLVSGHETSVEDQIGHLPHCSSLRLIQEQWTYSEVRA